MKHKQHTVKKIGFYDSGIGGMFLMSHVRKTFPAYDYVFFGDEANLPYGSKSVTELIPIARTCIDYLFDKENCDVVVIACNTMSAVAYPTLSLEYKSKKH
jgi:glutamate racemase